MMKVFDTQKCIPLNHDESQLPHLVTFSEAAELGSFSAAARALGLTQGAVSQRIGALEQAVGKSLFERRGGRILLTDAGQRLYVYAQQILELHRTARREISGREVPVSRELLLAASSVPGEHLLPELLAAFGERYPNIRVHATVTDSREALAQVDRGDVHLGLVGWKGDDPNLEFRPLGCDRLVLVIPAGHAWGRRKTATLAQLSSEPLILRERGSGQRNCFADSLARAGKSMNELRVVLELGSNEAIKEAVLRGLGVAVLSETVVPAGVRRQGLRTLRIQGLDCRRDLFVVRDCRRALPLAARLFRDHVESLVHSAGGARPPSH